MLKLSEQQEDRAISLHKKAVVITTHSDVTSCDVAEQRSRGEKQVLLSRHLPVWKEGGVTATIETVGGTTLHQTFPLRELITAASNPTKRTLKIIDYVTQDLEESRGEISLATSAEEISAAKKEGRVCLIFGFEGADPIDDDLGLLRIFYRLGVRCIEIAWIYRNRMLDGVWEPTNSGLTHLGIEAVEEMNRLGILVDVSHSTEAGFWDMLKYSRDPVVATHCNARAKLDHARNLTDEQIKALSEKDGVIGLNMNFASPKEPSMELLLDQLEYLIEVGGVDHIGLGLDLNSTPWPIEAYREIWRGTTFMFPFSYPKELDTPAKLPNITRELVARGYSDSEIEKVLGTNMLRLFKRVFRK
jgi:membrane dipeptidase